MCRNLGFWSMRKLVMRSLLMTITTIFILTISASFTTAESLLPMSSIAWNGQYARIPDWSKITLRSLPPIQTNGAFSSPEASQAVGYDLARSWKAGQTADQYLKLGDLQTSLYPQLFNLDSIAQLTGFDVNQTALSTLKVIAWQTLDDLIAAIPELGNYSIQQLPPIQALLAKKSVNLNATLAEVLQNQPELGQLTLGSLGKQLEQFAIADLPGLPMIPLQNLKNWENSKIAGVPGLAEVPLAQMPNPLNATGVIGIVDIVYGTKERDRTQTISGSDQQGFQVSCKINCAHVELTGDAALQGKQWISGQ